MNDDGGEPWEYREKAQSIYFLSLTDRPAASIASPPFFHILVRASHDSASFANLASAERPIFCRRSSGVGVSG